MEILEVGKLYASGKTSWPEVSSEDKRHAR